MTHPNWSPAPEYTARKDQEQSNKDCSLAVEILKIAQANAHGKNVPAHELANDAEVLWQWVTTDSWVAK